MAVPDDSSGGRIHDPTAEACGHLSVLVTTPVAGAGTATQRTAGLGSRRSNPDKAQEDLDKLVTDGYLVGAHVAPSRKGGRPRFEYRLKGVTETPALTQQSGGSGSGDTGDAAGRDNKPAEDWGSL